MPRRARRRPLLPGDGTRPNAWLISDEGARSALPALAICLVFSGAASLILETVWARSLRLIFGSTTLATSTVLVAYMVGLGCGGLLGGRLARRVRNGIRTYGLLEIGIGFSAAAVPLAFGLLPHLNRQVLAALDFWPATLGRFFAVLVVLLPPTLLMGATLPVAVAALGQTAGARSVGLLYGANTAGAVGGVLLATFSLFRVAGMTGTNLAAAALSCMIGAVAVFALAERPSRRPQRDAASGRTGEGVRRRWSPALLGYALVGFTALLYEVCWTRALALVLGSSVYAFAAMLAAFLMGIAFGSFAVHRRLPALRRPELLYAGGVGLLGLLAYLTSLSFNVLPDVFLAILRPAGLSETAVVGASFTVATLSMLLPTLVLGALFPLFVRTYAQGEHTGASVGSVYFANTVGSAAGAFAAGFLLIPRLGVARTIALGIAVNLTIAALSLFRHERRAAAAAAVLAVLAFAFPPHWNEKSLTRGVYRNPAELLASDLTLLPLKGVPEDALLFYRDGLNATVSVHRTGGEIALRINGKGEAGTGNEMPVQSLAGQIPMLFGPRAERVLVIGLASGVTAGSAALHEPDRLDIVEIEPAVIEASRFFEDYNNRPLERPFTRVVLDDARSHVASTAERYDVIISVPSNPWTSGSASLFTREFFADVRRLLRPGGRFFQWVELYGLDPTGVGAILAALRESFPVVYGFAQEAGASDLLLLATDRALTRDDLPDWNALGEPVRNELRRTNVFSTADLWSLFRLPPAGVEEVARSAGVVNSDRNMFIELRAPWTLYDAAAIQQNWDRLIRHRPALLSIADQGTPLDADGVAELALSYASVRNDLAAARDLLGEAKARGGGVTTAVAEAELLLGEHPEAGGEVLARLNGAIAAAPEAFLPRFHRARLLALAERNAEALEDVEVAIGSAPDDLRARYLRLQLLVALGRGAEARAEAERLLASPYARVDPQVWAYAARSAAMLGRFDEAIPEMRRYLEWNPTSAIEWPTLAAMYDATGRVDLAADARTNEQLAARNRILVNHQLARRMEALGDREQALDLLRETVQTDPGYQPAVDDLRRLEAGS